MTDSNPIVTMAAEAAGLPSVPADGPFAKLFSSLFGVPTAWMRRPARAIDDVTDARSSVSQGIAAEVIKRAISDPEIMKAAEAAYLPTNLRRIANRTAVIAIATEELDGAAAQPGSEDQTAAAIDEDWVNTFIRYADDASSDRLQRLFGKVLAGQINRPGTFSPSTLRFLSELTQDMAADFSWAWAKDIGGKIWRSEDFSRGENWARVQRLREAGLISPMDAATYSPPFNPEVSTTYAWMPALAGEFSLTVVFDHPIERSLSVAFFSKIGNEVGLLLPTPDYRANMTEVANALKGPHVSKLILHLPQGEFENLPTTRG